MRKTMLEGYTKQGIELKDRLNCYNTLYCSDYKLTIAYGKLSILFVNNIASCSGMTAIKTALTIAEPDKWIPLDTVLENMPIDYEENTTDDTTIIESFSKWYYSQSDSYKNAIEAIMNNTTLYDNSRQDFDNFSDIDRYYDKANNEVENRLQKAIREYAMQDYIDIVY